MTILKCNTGRCLQTAIICPSAAGTVLAPLDGAILGRFAMLKSIAGGHMERYKHECTYQEMRHNSLQPSVIIAMCGCLSQQRDSSNFALLHADSTQQGAQQNCHQDHAVTSVTHTCCALSPPQRPAAAPYCHDDRSITLLHCPTCSNS